MEDVASHNVAILTWALLGAVPCVVSTKVC